MKSRKEEGPDRGWSWVIAFACFSISLILFGIYRTSGILLVAFVNEYDVSREDSSWPIFLCFSVVDLTGLIVGPLGLKFGIRPITIVGSLISALGVSLCYFAHSLDFIIVSFGVIFGVGFGLTYTLMPVIINEYFLNHRATANGIANAGGCFGSVILPPLYEHLTSTYGLNGCLLLIGGIILQLAIAGALMKPPSWLKKDKSEAEVDKFSENGQFSEHLVSSLIDKSVNLSNSQICKSSSYVNVDIITQDVMFVNITSNGSTSNKEIEHLCDKNLEQDNLNSEKNGIINNPLCFNRHSKDETANIGEIELSAKYCGKHYVKDTSLYTELIHESFEGANYTTVNDVDDKSIKPIPKEVQKAALITDTANLQNISVNEEDIFECLESDKLIQGKQTAIVLSNAAASVLKETKMAKCLNKDLSLDKTYGNESSTSEEPLMQCEKVTYEPLEIPQSEVKGRMVQNVQNTGKDCDLTILQSFKNVLTCPMFYVIAMSNVFFFSNEEMFFVINADFYIDKGVTEKDVKYIIIAFSACDLIGRLCFGWVTDRKFLKRSHFMMLCMVFVAVIFISFPFANGYMSLMVLNCLYGLILGCTTIVFTVLPVDYLHMDIQAIAFGCIGFLCGILTLTCSLLIGYFRDNMGSYSNIFYLMGVLSVVTSFLWLLENVFVKPSNPPPNSEIL